jgi:hypothetical protein
MNGMKMFNAMANVDRELLDNSAAPAGQKHIKTARPGSAWVRWITLTASFLLCAGLVIGICVMVNNRTKNGNRSGETGNSDPYSKYYGLWVEETFSTAIQFCENQKYYYYLLNNEDPLKYDFKYSGTYSIEDDVLLWYPDDEQTVTRFTISCSGSAVTITEEDDDPDYPVTFNKAEYTLTPFWKYGYDQNDQRAMDFRNIPWYYEADNLSIVFGGNRYMSVSFIDTGTRKGEWYEWDENTNTVTFPDWNDPEGRSWTGRIEDGALVLTSGNDTITLLDPDKTRNRSFPTNVYLDTGNGYYAACKIIFRRDGTYTVGYLNQSKTDFQAGLQFNGRYELDGSFEDADGHYITIYPSDEDASFISQGHSLRYFADYSESGTRIQFMRDGEEFKFILKREGVLTIRLYMYAIVD